MWGFYSKLRSLKQQMRIWNREVFGNIFDSLEAAETEVTHSERAYDATSMDDLR